MLIQAKSNLARLMATENLVVEERNVETAYFDVKSRILTVPILDGNLSNNVYDLLLGHEVGHALETPAEGWHDSLKDHQVNKSILNVCEDVRIEKKIKRKFPGLKLSFVRGYHELMEMNFFGIKGVNLNELNFIDRVNIYSKGGSSQGIVFSDEETVLLKEIEETETWPQVVEVARKVQEFMKSELDRQEKEKNNKAKVKVVSVEEGDKTVDSETDDYVNVEIDSVEMDTETIGEDAKNKESDTNSSDNESKEDEGRSGEGSGEQGSKGTDENLLKSDTDETFRKREKELYNNEKGKDIVYSTIPKTNLENITFDYTEVLNIIEYHNKKVLTKNGYSRLNTANLAENFVKFKNESTKIVSYLVKEFELRKNAEQQKRASVSKTGDLNMDRIFEYKLTDDIFRRMTNVPNGKSHGLVMFVDWSGSMADHLAATIRQLLNLVMFCKKVNIPFEVYAFTTQWQKKETYNIEAKQKPKVGDLVLNSHFSLMNLLSSRMNSKEYMTMAKYMLDIGQGGYRSFTRNFELPEELSLGGTPLNSAIITAFDIIPKFQHDNKLQIVNAVFLTDGESSSVDGRFSYIDYRSNHICDTSHVPNSRRRSFLRDEITKATEEIPLPKNSNYGGTALCETNALLKLLKQRCECNIVGFYISTARRLSETISLYSEDENDIEKRKLHFRDKGFLIVTNSGYDEYYLIKSSALDLDEAELEIKTTTTRGFINAFHKYTGNKISSRIILNRFIGMIS